MSTITTLNDWITGASFRWQVNTNFANLNTDKAELSGATFTGDIIVPAEAYGAGWNGSNEVPTKNDLYDKIETMWGGWATTFLWLTDTPSSYSWQTGKFPKVNAGETALEFVTIPGGGDMLASTYDPAGIAQQVAGLTATQTFSTGLKTFLSGMFGLRNVANTFTSFFTNTNTASRTYTLQDSSDTLVWRATTDTLTNKRVTRRLVAVTQSATPAINTDNMDIASITWLAQAITSMTSSLTGTPVNGDMMMIQITDNGTARAITWGASFASANATYESHKKDECRSDWWDPEANGKFGKLYFTV